jgi:hypothetical protein
LRQCCSSEFETVVMNMPLPKEAEKPAAQFASIGPGIATSKRWPFLFEEAAGHQCLDMGRYIMLMRRHHGKGEARGAVRFRSLAGS